MRETANLLYTGEVEVRGLLVFVATCLLAASAILSIPANATIVETEVLTSTLSEPVEPPDLLAAVTSTSPPPSASPTIELARSTVNKGASTTVPEPIAPPTTINLVAPQTTALSSVPVTTAEPQSIGQQALSLVRFDWRARFPDWQITFSDGRSGIRALTYPREQRIDVFVRASDTPQTLHRVIAHELGHMVDVASNSFDERNRWIEQRGLANEVPWWPGESAPDFATGAGDFAEAFAVWETGVQSQSTVGGQPDAGDLAVLIEIVG